MLAELSRSPADLLRVALSFPFSPGINKRDTAPETHFYFFSGRDGSSNPLSVAEIFFLALSRRLLPNLFVVLCPGRNRRKHDGFLALRRRQLSKLLDPCSNGYCFVRFSLFTTARIAETYRPQPKG